MIVRSATFIFFSPTGTTKTIVENISKGIIVEQINKIDITRKPNREHALRFTDEIVILATPVYYGRVPEVVESYLSTLKADQTPVVLVVVYGNRAYDDALIELHDIAIANKFIPVAGGAFVAEHSYSSSAYPIASGRPDDIDMLMAQEFGMAVMGKIQNLKSIDRITPLNIPGQIPYIEPKNLNMIKEARSVVDLTPETDQLKCTLCGQCVEACPTDAISINDVIKTDKWKCLICFACIKSCPEKARQMNEPHFQIAIEQLHQACLIRKEPEFYL